MICLRPFRPGPKRFATSRERADPGRAQRKFKIEVATQVELLFKNLLPDDYCVKKEGLHETLSQAMEPIMFAVARNRETCSAETGHLPTMRLMVGGTRKVLLVHTAALWRYLQDTLKLPQLSAKKIYGWLKSSNIEALKAISQSSSNPVLFEGSIGPQAGALHAAWVDFPGAHLERRRRRCKDPVPLVR